MPQLSDGNLYSPRASYNSPITMTALPLLPFHHQVGGHSTLFRFSKRAICKPMSKKEQEFYEYLEQHHAPILPFTSQYLGVVNVTYRSSNTQPTLPEVTLEKNQHLLAGWKNDCSNDPPHRQQQQQQQQCPPRINLRQHSSSFKLNTRSDAFDLKNSTHTNNLETKPTTTSSLSPRSFKEQVLGEVFSPSALQERLQQVQHWQHGMRQRELEDSIHANRNTFAYNDSSNNSIVGGDNKGQHDNEYRNKAEETIQPRKSSLIESTTSTPQTSRTRRAELCDPCIRPPSSYAASASTNIPVIRNVSVPSFAHPHSQLNTVASETCSSTQHYQSLQTQQHDDCSSRAAAPTNWRPKQEPTNPWSVQMYQRDREKVSVNDIQQFILIEDLTDGIKYPCVLDLKMGVRQHSVYSSTKKMISQSRKCQLSTSLQLGVRISGMQIYNVKDQQFLFEDKYMGRAMTPLTFRDSLVRYFNNGEGCHIIHLPTLIRKLALIYHIIKTMDAYRFYASSLLIIYDAADNIISTSTRPRRRIDVRLIDFAKSITKDEWMSEQHRFTYPPKSDEGEDGLDKDDTSMGPDQGYLLGVQTLISCFFWIYVNHGGNKDDLMDLDDTLLSMDRLSWLDGDDDTSNR